MPDKRITLVLGAGASAPYGFPIGSALVKDICTNFQPWAERVARESEVPAPFQLGAFVLSVADRSQDFVTRLSRFGGSSIDAFLQGNPRFREAGKVAIARALLPKERESGQRLFEPQAQPGHLYQRLFKSLGIPPFSSQRLSIITYNYDRSLEHFLHSALVNSYEDQTPAKAAQNLEQVPIVHVHGKLGRLPFERGKGTVGYGAADTGDVLTAGEGIKIIYEEDIDGSQELARAHRVLSETDVLLFMGFGYDRDNVARLKLSEVLRDHVTIEGTHLGATVVEAETVKDRLYVAAGKRHKVTVYNTYDCVDLLRGTTWLQ